MTTHWDGVVYPWLRSAADAGLIIFLLGLLLFLFAAEAAFLGLPQASMGPMPEQHAAQARLTYYAEQPQLIAWANVAWQAAISLSLLVWLSHVMRAGSDTWQLSHASLALSFLWLCMLAFRLLGQLIGRALGDTIAIAAMPLLAPTAIVLRRPFTLLMRAAARVGLAAVTGASWQAGPKKGAPLLACGPFWTADTLAELTHQSLRQGSERGVDLFASLTTFSGTVIREVMVPRTAVLAISLTATEAEVVHAMRDGQHSRVPVYDDTIDHMVGLLHVKALFEQQQSGAPFSLKPLLRPTFYVPEIMRISMLLQEFQRRKTHMAIVVDEYGGTSGIVTLEDIIEEIVGEIHDEYDVEEKQLRVLQDGKILADAKISIDDVEKALQKPLVTNGEYESLGGFLVAHLGHVPTRGFVIDIGEMRFTVKDATERRIIAVEIERRRK